METLCRLSYWGAHPTRSRGRQQWERLHAGGPSARIQYAPGGIQCSVPWFAVPLGLVTGTVMGALGGGGAILTIPVLIYLLGMPPHTATTASLVIVGVSAAASALGHLRAGRVRVLDAVVLAVVGAAGTTAGSWAATAVSGRMLVALLAALLAVVGGLMVRRGEPLHPAPAPVGWSVRRVARIAVPGVGIGLLTGFFGVGGGFAIVPALTLVLGYPVKTAIGTSLLVTALNSATALLARTGQGIDLDWPLVGLFTVGAAAGGLLGGMLGRRADPRRLTQGFAGLLFALAAYMLVRSWLG